MVSCTCYLTTRKYSLQAMTFLQLHKWCMHIIKMGNIIYKAGSGRTISARVS
jgi:hypothetical protein